MVRLNESQVMRLYNSIELSDNEQIINASYDNDVIYITTKNNNNVKELELYNIKIINFILNGIKLERN